MVEVGQPAPDFELQADDGSTRRLADFRGRKLVLYFYPKDNTPGCTTEAQAFRDRMADIEAAGATVVGVSPDSVASHARFKGKHELPFALLSDPDKVALQAYGAWGEKKLYGRTFMGVIRSTVLIDERGVVAHVWPKVRVKGHVDAVIEALG